MVVAVDSPSNFILVSDFCSSFPVFRSTSGSKSGVEGELVLVVWK